MVLNALVFVMSSSIWYFGGWIGGSILYITVGSMMEFKVGLYILSCIIIRKQLAFLRPFSIVILLERLANPLVKLVENDLGKCSAKRKMLWLGYMRLPIPSYEMISLLAAVFPKI